MLLGVASVAALLGVAGGAAAQTPGVGDCQPNQYLDRSAAGADRTLDWGFTITTDPERCMKVQVGQSVTWSGDLEMHPLGSGGGTQPNPIAANQNGVVTFTSPGTYGFVCLSHSSMKGAIFVVPAPAVPTAAAPATPWWALGALLAALAAGGVVAMRRRAVSA